MSKKKTEPTPEPLRTRYESRKTIQQEPPPPISEILKEFRTRFELTQTSAAQWLFLPAGTYRDYEQGRSHPARIIEAGIHARIADYARRYKEWIKGKGKDYVKLETAAR